jgi:hypothetical protein
VFVEIEQEDKNLPCVGVRGMTSAGKTSACNALLGVERLLDNTNFGESLSTVPVVLTNEPSFSGYTVLVRYTDAAHWLTTRAEFVQLVRASMESNKDLSPGNVEVARRVLEKHYGELKTISQLNAMAATESKDLSALIGTTQYIPCAGLEELRACLYRLTSKGKAPSKKVPATPEPSQLWPLIDEVN